MPDEIAKLAEAILRDPVRINVAPVKATTALIEESVCFVPRKQKTEVLSQILQRRNVGRAIVFTRTKHGADRVAKQLHRAGIKADAIHGNKTQSSRQRILAGFKAGRTHVLVATDVASRGIDIDDVSHVFNYDLPHEPESYVHRIGRTGRAGATGFAVSLCDREERPLLAAIQRLVRRTLPVDAEASVEPAPTARELNSTDAAPQPGGKRRKFNGARSGHRPGGSGYSPQAGRPGNYPPRFPRKKKGRKALPTRQG
jgi:ATP-dependent RNA helicase RhlE